jgi:hypothetical protein
VRVALLAQASHELPQCLGPLVRADDDGNEHGGSIAMASGIAISRWRSRDASQAARVPHWRASAGHRFPRFVEIPEAIVEAVPTTTRRLGAARGFVCVTEALVFDPSHRSNASSALRAFG